MSDILSPSVSPRALQDLRSAADLLLAGRADEASRVLRPIVAAYPGLADAHRLLGLAARDSGDLTLAEASLRRAVALDPASGPSAVSLAETLLFAARAREALAVVAPLAADPRADIHILTTAGNAEKALGRLEDAVATYGRAVVAAPASGVAEHNLAGVLGDLERFSESEAAARRAFATGLDAPETWVVLARAHMGQRAHDQAHETYLEAIRRRPDYVEAHAELAQLVWMRTADVVAAGAMLDRAIAAFPDLQALRLTKGELLEYAGDMEGAWAAVAATAARPDAEAMIHVVAARFSMGLDPLRARAHAVAAAAQIPDHPVALGTLCEAHLANGEAEAAEAVAADLHRRGPLDQHALGLLATSWRLRGDPRQAALHDYPSLVRAATIDTPRGWPDLRAYLADLADSLTRLHTLRTHPIGQSIRHGSQTSQSLTLSDDPVIQAFFRAVDGPIRRYMAALGPGDDPVRSRNTGDYRFNGAWSVRLRPDGYHADHLHPMGWLSSACYIALPSAVERGHEGWLKFGQPGVRTEPPLAPEYFVKPEPGLLVLFPSWMW
ncbi:MAG: putative 2OG-Fe(II) oxygenase, partial [Caulobacteraceae bacterium]